MTSWALRGGAVMARTKIPGPLLGVLILLPLLGCQQPSDTDSRIPPSQPPYLDVAVTFDRLQGDQGSERLNFDIKFVGDPRGGNDSMPLITFDGDTTSYLWLYFVTGWRTELLEANPDSVWHGKVEVGQRIRIGYDFQITDTTEESASSCCKGDNPACHVIGLGARFDTAKLTLAERDTVRSFTGTSTLLYFNHRTGGYKLNNPFGVWQNYAGAN